MTTIKKFVTDSLGSFSNTTRVRSSMQSSGYKKLEADVFGATKSFASDKKALKGDVNKIGGDMKKAIQIYKSK